MYKSVAMNKLTEQYYDIQVLYNSNNRKKYNNLFSFHEISMMKYFPLYNICSFLCDDSMI